MVFNDVRISGSKGGIVIEITIKDHKLVEVTRWPGAFRPRL